MDVDIVEEFLMQQLKLDSTEGEGSENNQTLANCNVFSIHKEFEDVKKVIQEKKRGTVASLREARRENLYYLLNIKTDWLELSKKPHFLNLMTAKYNELSRRINQIKNKLEEATPKSESESESESRKHKESWFPSDPNPQSYRWSSQAVELKKIHGFEDKGMIMERLLLKEGAKAVGIVGVAGVGKTALCQLAFNRDQVRDHFPLRIWLCFSNQSKLEETEGLLVKRILSCLGFEDRLIGEVEKAGKLQLALRRQLKCGRYLIVLDDVWTTKGEADRKLFSFLTGDQDGDGVGSGHGGALIVTSRYEDLDQMLGPKISKHTLLPLADDDSCWNIFSDAVNKDGTVQLPEEMMNLKEEIVKKCEGLPLMAKMLGQIGHHLAKIHRQTDTTN